MYAVAPMGAMTYSLRSEMTEGTLEQMTMSPLLFSVGMAGRLFGALLVNTLEMIIMGLSTWLILRVNLTLSAETLVILLVIIVGVSGFAYLVAVVLVFLVCERSPGSRAVWERTEVGASRCLAGKVAGAAVKSF